MGQRLDIEISVSNKVDDALANTYYHWSAYTSSALPMVSDIITVYKQMGQEAFRSNPCVAAIHLLESTGAGLTELEMAKANGEFPGESFKPAVNRNEGLLAFTPEGMNETRGWAEGSVVIDIVHETVNFNVFSYFKNEDELKECFELSDEDLEEDYKITNLNYDPFNVSFEDWNDFCYQVLNGSGLYRLPSSELIMNIE